ncbi:unnamed protein product [Mycena citricolor]|uniref:C2H2-type domain-containing protein n=1 Tax=Mycena citricolor TaxID=2018698 RepID=A0AAD2HSD2_9AGAR|nr:unnamed protein product [Mycena citricolor]
MSMPPNTQQQHQHQQQYAHTPVFDDFGSTDFDKGFDFSSFQSPSDVLAPHPDLFELELDTNLADFDADQLQLLTVDSHDAYSFFRSDTPTRGPASNITAASSEGGFDSLSSYSESFYNYPHSPQPPSNYSFPLDLEMDFRRITVDAATSDYAAGVGTDSAASAAAALFSPPIGHDAAGRSTGKIYSKAGPYRARSTYSDYGPSTRRPSVPVDLYAHLNFNPANIPGSTVSPAHISSQLPAIPAGKMADDEELHSDARKKYKCSACPRAFARAYNLKTHMATHDPNRLKPHVCPHRDCGRSFSRKHDLGRHLVSIHREGSQVDGSVCSSHHSLGSKKSIGVEQGTRSWCERCGRGLVGPAADCECT